MCHLKVLQETSPTINMTLFPLNSSGSGRNTPASESGVNAGTVVRSASSPVDVYTEQIHTRVRGRQMSFKSRLWHHRSTVAARFTST